MKNLFRRLIEALQKWVKGKDAPEKPDPVTPEPTPAPAACTCDLSGQRIAPDRFGGEYETPVPNGLDIRFLCWHPDKGDWVFVPRPAGVTIAGKTITATCPGNGWHYVGYKAPRSAGPMIREATGQYQETYRLYYERRAQ